MKTSLWLSLDKEGENDLSVGGYVYSFNNPINFTDPDGNWPDLPSWKEVKKSYNTAKTYVSNQTTKAINYVKNHAVAKVEGKLTFGAQLGVKTPFGSLGGGAATVDLIKVKATTKKGGSYFKGPNEMDGKGHYFLKENLTFQERKQQL